MSNRSLQFVMLLALTGCGAQADQPAEAGRPQEPGDQAMPQRNLPVDAIAPSVRAQHKANTATRLN
jgi:hypothetical protein